MHYKTINNALKYFYHAFCKANIKKGNCDFISHNLSVFSKCTFSSFDHGIKIYKQVNCDILL